MEESKRLKLLALAEKGELYDNAGNSIGVNHPSLKAPEVKKEVEPINTTNNEIATVMELITEAMNNTKKVQDDSAKAILNSQKVLANMSEDNYKKLLDAINENKNEETTEVVVEAKPKELEKWEFIHKRDSTGKLISSIANQLQ